MVKINKQKLIMEEVEQFDNISIEELAEGAPHAPVWCFNDTSADDWAMRTELPENSPRYIVLSYELSHSDGRKSFPLVMINWVPRSSEMTLLTLHASAFLDFQATVRAFPGIPWKHELALSSSYPGGCRQSY